MEARNEKCGCGSGVKYKKCCGRFSYHELFSRLSEFAKNNRRKDTMISKALELHAKQAGDENVLLCLANPQPTKDGFIEWTFLDGKVPVHEQEAVITRRVLSGYLPIGWLRKKPTWGAELYKTFVPEEYQAAYVAFARAQMSVIAGTLDGKMDKYDSKMLPCAWSDRSYPGTPVKPRPSGTIRIEVNLDARSVRVIVEPLNVYLDCPIDPEVLGVTPEADAINVAAHVIEAMEQTGSPNGAVPGDVFEIFLVQTDGTPKLLGRRKSRLAPSGLSGKFAMGGAA